MATDDEKCKDAQKWRHTGAGTTENLKKKKSGALYWHVLDLDSRVSDKARKRRKKLHVMYMFRIICGSTQQSSAFLHFAA